MPPLGFDVALGFPVDLPGYLGKRRDEKCRRWDAEYGQGNWQLAHMHRDRRLAGDNALELYERCYVEHLRCNPDILDRLVAEASDVYDNAPSNVDSGLDWHVQETGSNHLQDIAVRRALRALGRRFEGTKLVEIRGIGSAGYLLNPGRIPFFDPTAILAPRGLDADWVQPGSLEDFWQSNKVLFIGPGGLAAATAALEEEVSAGRSRLRHRLAPWLRLAWVAGRWEDLQADAALRLATPTRAGEAVDWWEAWTWKSLRVLPLADGAGDEAWWWRRVSELGPVADIVKRETMLPGFYARGHSLPARARAAAAMLTLPRMSPPTGVSPDAFNNAALRTCLQLVDDVEIHPLLEASAAGEVLRKMVGKTHQHALALLGWAQVMANAPSSRGAALFARIWLEPINHLLPEAERARASGLAGRG